MFILECVCVCFFLFLTGTEGGHEQHEEVGLYGVGEFGFSI